MDKILHFAAGLIIAVAVGWIVAPMAGLLAGMAAGVLKEVRDELAYGGSDLRDLLVTCVGAAVGWAAI